MPAGLSAGTISSDLANAWLFPQPKDHSSIERVLIWWEGDYDTSLEMLREYRRSNCIGRRRKHDAEAPINGWYDRGEDANISRLATHHDERSRGLGL